MESKDDIQIYIAPNNETRIEVSFDKETVWLSQKLMAELFEKDSDTIGLHLKNIFSEGELEEGATTELFSVVRTEGNREVTRQIKFYNLDAILSVGYRVNSKRGTAFRQWATARLKELLVQGYAVNRKRLAELQKVIDIIELTSQSEELRIGEAKGLLEIIKGYTQSFVLLNQYDSDRLEPQSLKAILPISAG